jgi:PHD/YefM family antitoxin component YafN of YafNO toxin-antitoxin module
MRIPGARSGDQAKGSGNFPNIAIVTLLSDWYGLVMNAIRKKIVVDERGNPREVIISWAQFREMSEALGLDLDEKAKLDLRATRRDLKGGKTTAFKPLSAL